MCSIAPSCATACLFSLPGITSRWPLLDQLTVRVGGTDVSAADALAACAALESSGASAIRSVLQARGNPLAACDYHAVYQPGMDAARAALAEKKGCIGPRGRHLAKHVFCQVVREHVRQAACQALRRALHEVSTDDRYVTAIARDGHAAGRHRRLQAA